jgi:hypothetical protein
MPTEKAVTMLAKRKAKKQVKKPARRAPRRRPVQTALFDDSAAGKAWSANKIGGAYTHGFDPEDP